MKMITVMLTLAFMACVTDPRDTFRQGVSSQSLLAECDPMQDDYCGYYESSAGTFDLGGEVVGYAVGQDTSGIATESCSGSGGVGTYCQTVTNNNYLYKCTVRDNDSTGVTTFCSRYR